MNTERESGSRQDIITMGAGPIYWKRIFNVEFVDNYLCIKDNTNIIQKYISTILTSIEMIVTSRFFAILHVVICMMFFWLTGNTHKIAHRNWIARSMGCAIDILHTACNNLFDDPRLINEKSFMMHIYDPLMDEIPEFKYYMDYQC